ncbi:hypothetical protein TI39_contig264g00005 [Zymoseptoria brevis]|uniref:Uncharacterized protein n=1 Tax=Zymoseptoria brevis TaxID=1047168 RepID=A0A0F4GX55_9PEZI|nr:hypothetical protein TI39_contig264g00005 [Zymoseptoria brevis]
MKTFTVNAASALAFGLLVNAQVPTELEPIARPFTEEQCDKNAKWLLKHADHDHIHKDPIDEHWTTFFDCKNEGVPVSPVLFAKLKKQFPLILKDLEFRSDKPVNAQDPVERVPTGKQCDDAVKYLNDEGHHEHIHTDEIKEHWATFDSCRENEVRVDPARLATFYDKFGNPPVGVHPTESLEGRSDKPVKCKECKTMFDSDSEVQHRDFADCALMIQRGNCPKEFPDGLFGIPSFEDLTGHQKRGEYPTTAVEPHPTYPSEPIKPYGMPPKVYSTVEQPKTQPPVTVTSTLTSPPQIETTTCYETVTETPKAYTELKTLTETCTETSTLEKYLTATEMKSYPVTVPTTITATETFTKVPECPTITTSCTHWTVSETHPAYPETHPSYPVNTPPTHPGYAVTTKESSHPGYAVSTEESSQPGHPVSTEEASKPGYAATTQESSQPGYHVTYSMPTQTEKKEYPATNPVAKASTTEQASYPVTSPAKPVYPVANNGTASMPYYKPSVTGSKTEVTSKYNYPTESVIATGDSSRVTMGMGLALGMVMAAMFVCA